MNRPRGTEHLARALVRLVPRSLRADFGGDMVQVACDRRRHGGEPVWRLWPSLVTDISSVAIRLRWEEAMFPVRALLFGVGIAVAVLGVLGGDPVISVAVILVMVVASRLFRRDQGQHLGGANRPRPWLVTGAGLCVAALIALAVNGDRELSEPQWAAVFLTMVLGLIALGTGAVLAATGRAPRDPGRGIIPPRPAA